MHNALILNYHSLDVGKTGPEYHVDPVYSVKEADFGAQMALLKKLCIPVVSMDELVENDRKRKRWHRHVAVITFDDGFLTDYETAFPILKQYNFPTTFFITVQNQLSEERWEQWREIAATPGFSLGSHTVSHPYLTDLPLAQMQQELLESKQIIEAKTGAEVKYLAPPYGRCNAAVIAAAQDAGYDALLTTNVGVNRFNADLFQLKRWTVRRKTTLAEFEKMLCRDKKTLLQKEVRSQVLNSGKKVLGTGPFEKIRNLIIKQKP